MSCTVEVSHNTISWLKQCIAIRVQPRLIVTALLMNEKTTSMRFSLLILSLFLALFMPLLAQDDEVFFTKNLSANWGIYVTTVNKSGISHSMQGTLYSVEYAKFHKERVGYRTGVNVVRYLYGNDYLISMPFYITYRTSTESRRFNNSALESADNFFGQLLFVVLPKNFEFFGGCNLGYVDCAEPEIKSTQISKSLSYQNYFSADRHFLASLDAGLRMKYRIGRMGIVFAPSISYLASGNYKFTTTDPNDASNGVRPHIFFRITGGLAYNF